MSAPMRAVLARGGAARAGRVRHAGGAGAARGHRRAHGAEPRRARARRVGRVQRSARHARRRRVDARERAHDRAAHAAGAARARGDGPDARRAASNSTSCCAARAACSCTPRTAASGSSREARCVPARRPFAKRDLQRKISRRRSLIRSPGSWIASRSCSLNELAEVRRDHGRRDGAADVERQLAADELVQRLAVWDADRARQLRVELVVELAARRALAFRRR